MVERRRNLNQSKASNEPAGKRAATRAANLATKPVSEINRSRTKQSPSRSNSFLVNVFSRFIDQVTKFFTGKWGIMFAWAMLWAILPKDLLLNPEEEIDYNALFPEALKTTGRNLGILLVGMFVLSIYREYTGKEQY